MNDRDPAAASEAAAARELRTAVVAPQSDTYSETFIRAQVEQLPGHVDFLYGGFLPEASANGGPPTYRSVRVAAGALAGLTGRSVDALSRALVRRAPGLSREEGLARYLEATGVDVVLAQFGPTGVVMSEVCRATGIPLVVHFHGYDAYRHDVLARWGEGYRRAFARAAAVVAVSRDMREQLLRLGAPREKLHLRPYGVDLGKFAPPPSDRPGGPPRVLAVGRFVDKKAPHLTILAFQRVLSASPSAELHMVGDGPLLGACRILVGALGLGDRVRFHGVLPHDEIATWMRRADVYVQHSVVAPDGDSEGTPVSVLEAAASRLPIVATRHAGIEDVLEDGVSGHLVDEGDVDGMAAALERVLEDPGRAAAMGRAARRRVEEGYAGPDAIRGLHEILVSAARRRPEGSER